MKNLKRMVAVVLSIVSVFMCCMVNTSANVVEAASKPKNYWIDEGNYTKDWVSSETGKDVYGHEGTATDPYEIQNEQDLAALSYCTNNMNMTFADKYINITATSLDMSIHFWTPIAENSPLQGNLNGNGCAINNLFMGNRSYYDGTYTGFIGQSCGNISNVSVQGFRFYTQSTASAGLVGSWLAGNIDGCNVKGVIFNSSTSCSIGGLVGVAKAAEGQKLGNVTNCTVAAEIGSYVDGADVNCIGGLVGTLNEQITFENCTSALETEMYNNYYVGTLAGLVTAHTQINNCNLTYYIYTKNNCLANSMIGKTTNCALNVSNCTESGAILNGTY